MTTISLSSCLAQGGRLSGSESASHRRVRAGVVEECRGVEPVDDLFLDLPMHVDVLLDLDGLCVVGPRNDGGVAIEVDDDVLREIVAEGLFDHRDGLLGARVGHRLVDHPVQLREGLRCTEVVDLRGDAQFVGVVHRFDHGRVGHVDHVVLRGLVPETHRVDDTAILVGTAGVGGTRWSVAGRASLLLGTHGVPPW